MPYSDHFSDTRPEALRCGEHVLGFIKVQSCDHFWLLGHFTPGPDFEPYREIFADFANWDARFEALEELLSERELDEFPAGPERLAYEEAENRRENALDRIADLSLRMGDSDAEIQDFKLNANGDVEFRQRT